MYAEEGTQNPSTQPPTQERQTWVDIWSTHFFYFKKYVLWELIIRSGEHLHMIPFIKFYEWSYNFRTSRYQTQLDTTPFRHLLFLQQLFSSVSYVSGTMLGIRDTAVYLKASSCPSATHCRWYIDSNNIQCLINYLQFVIISMKKVTKIVYKQIYSV